MTDIKHTRADEVKPGRREITVANAIDIVHDDITFDAIHGTKSELKEINQTLLLILKQLQHITGEKE